MTDKTFSTRASATNTVALTNTVRDQPIQRHDIQSRGGATIELIDVTKTYPGQTTPAVDHVSLTIPAGEIVCLVGPSGCGKTTMMKLINRLIEPTSGEIRIGGQDAREQSPNQLRRGIGYVIQHGGLFPHYTVAQNVALVPRLLGWSKAKTTERIVELLDLVGLDHETFAARYPAQLSGGQQQRVGVARALAANPPVLLMDEPFGAVDPVTRGRLQDELLRINDAVGKTIVFVTHDMDEALKLGNRIAVLRDSARVVQYGPPSDILTHPADDTVTAFIGGDATVKLLRATRLTDASLDESSRPVEVARLDSPLTLRNTLHEALERLLHGDDDQLPVVDDGAYCGVISLRGIHRTVANLRDRRGDTP